MCGPDEFRDVFVEEVFLVNGNYGLVERIPARVCERCGEKLFICETTESVREIIHEGGAPIRRVEVDVFDLAQV